MPGAWAQFLRTGWEPFDREHTDLLSRLSELLSAANAADRARTAAVLDGFQSACADHFAHEERLMAENAYGQLARHKEAHDLFLADVAELSRELSTMGITPEFRRWAAGRVLEWFRFHIAANDVAVGAFLVGRRRASAPRVAAGAPVTPARGARR